MIRRQLWTWESVINVRRVRTSACCDECVVEEYRYVQHDRFRYPLHGESPGPVLVVGMFDGISRGVGVGGCSGRGVTRLS